MNSQDSLNLGRNLTADLSNKNSYGEMSNLHEDHEELVEDDDNEEEITPAELIEKLQQVLIYSI